MFGLNRKSKQQKTEKNLAAEVLDNLCKELDRRFPSYQGRKSYELVGNTITQCNSKIEDSHRNPIYGSPYYVFDSRFEVDPELQLLTMEFVFKDKFSEDKRKEGALSVCRAQSKESDCDFEYDYFTGTVTLRICEVFRDSEISQKLIMQMIDDAVKKIKIYHDKILFGA